MCDDLMEELNAKCVEDIANQKIDWCMLMVNQGQGGGRGAKASA